MQNPSSQNLMKALVLLSILLLAGIIILNPGSRQSPGVLAMVGEAGISSTDLSYKMAIEKAYGNEEVTEEVALVSLINDAVEHGVARINGVTATHGDIAAMSDHTDRTTKAPEILASVKQAFGSDRAAYERLYLEPRIINTKLRSWYSHNADVHRNERALIEKAYSLTSSGKSMEEAAQEYGLTSSTVDFGKENGTKPPLLEEYFPDRNKSQYDPMMAILENLSEGQIYQNIVEDDFGYRVIKLIQKNGSQYKVAEITSSKRPFSEWFSENAARVNVKILDKEMENKIVSKYQNVWWVSKLNK